MLPSTSSENPLTLSILAVLSFAMNYLAKFIIANRRIGFLLIATTAIGYFCGSALTGFFIGALIVSLVNFF